MNIVGIHIGTEFSALAVLTETGRPEIVSTAEGKRIMPSEDKTLEVTPAEVFSRILKKLIQDAEKILGGEIKSAAVTVPANFLEAARQATMDAAEAAGLEKVTLIEEPVAAALHYATEREVQGRALVFDLGRGTFDVTIADIEGQSIQVVTSLGDPRLGGKDFDRVLAEIISDQFKADSGEPLFKEDPSHELMDRAEVIKKVLSKSEEWEDLLIFETTEGEAATGKVEITRAQFEEGIASYLGRIDTLIDVALKEAEIEADGIDSILLVGGSTRIPCITDRLEKRFGKKPFESLNVDGVKALGAAFYMGMGVDPGDLSDDAKGIDDDDGDGDESGPQDFTVDAEEGDKSFETLRFSGDLPAKAGEDGAFTPSSREQKTYHAFILREAVKVSTGLFPKVSAVFEGVKSKLGLGPGVECFIRAAAEQSAFCYDLGQPFKAGREPLVAVVLTSGLVETMEEGELAFVFGHELGHFLFDHRSGPRPQEDDTELEILQAMQLSRAAEISSDRIGFICCGGDDPFARMETGFRAMLKLVSGLSEEHFRADLPAYLDQLRENKDILKYSAEIWSTHPMFPLRVKALNLFSMSQAYYDWAGREDRAPISTEKLDKMVKADFDAVSGMQLEKIYSGVTREAKLWGALRLFVIDNRLSKSEQAFLVEAFGEDTVEGAKGFLQGQAEEIVKAVEEKLAETLERAKGLPGAIREAVVEFLESAADVASAEKSAVMEELANISGKLGVDRSV